MCFFFSLFAIFEEKLLVEKPEVVSNLQGLRINRPEAQSFLSFPEVQSFL